MSLGLWLAAAWAASPVLLVLPPTGAPDDASIDSILRAHDLERAATVDPSRLLRDVEVLPVLTGLGADCPAAVDIDAWRRRLAAARRRVLVLQVEGALGDLLGLDLELECLSSPVNPEDMAALDLARAEADLLLASAAAGDDPARAAFYASEATLALDRAALVPPGAVPADTSADVADALAAARARRARDLPLRLAVVGRGSAELRVNGRVARRGVADAAVGDNLVQLSVQGRVRSAMRLHRAAGEGAILAVGGTLGRDEVASAIAGLVRDAPEPEEEELLLALAAAVGERVVFVGWDDRVATAWLADGDTLVPLQAPPPPPEAAGPSAAGRKGGSGSPARASRPKPAEIPDTGGGRGEWVATVGAALGPGAAHPLSDAAPTPGTTLEVGLFTRVVVAPRWMLAAATGASIPADTLDTLGSGVWARVPLRLGGRYGPARTGLAPEVGVDLGLRVDPDGNYAAVPFVAACGGGAAPGSASGLRLELCGGVSTDDLFAGLVLGVESRVQAR